MSVKECKFTKFDNVAFSVHCLEEYKTRTVKILGGKKYNRFFYNFPDNAIVVKKEKAINKLGSLRTEQEKQKSYTDRIGNILAIKGLIVSDKSLDTLYKRIWSFFYESPRKRNVVIQFTIVKINN